MREIWWLRVREKRREVWERGRERKRVNERDRDRESVCGTERMEERSAFV